MPRPYYEYTTIHNNTCFFTVIFHHKPLVSNI